MVVHNFTVQSLEDRPMDISLTSQLEKVVKEKVASGLYNSASEVVGEALRLLDDHDRLRQIKLERLRNDIQEGLDSGESAPLDIDAIKVEARKRRRVAQSKQRKRR
jgi:antitoxin ParD1/3/4